MQKIKDALVISKVETTESAWRYLPEKGSAAKGAQIDLLIHLRDDIINLCEIMFSAGNFLIDAKYAAGLRNKIEVFKSITGT